jgi:hypothetical protein
MTWRMRPRLSPLQRLWRHTTPTLIGRIPWRATRASVPYLPRAATKKTAPWLGRARAPSKTSHSFSSSWMINISRTSSGQSSSKVNTLIRNKIIRLCSASTCYRATSSGSIAFTSRRWMISCTLSGVKESINSKNIKNRVKKPTSFTKFNIQAPLDPWKFLAMSMIFWGSPVQCLLLILILWAACSIEI